MLKALGGDGGMGMKNSSVIIEEGGTSNGESRLEGKDWREREDFYSQHLSHRFLITNNNRCQLTHQAMNQSAVVSLLRSSWGIRMMPWLGALPTYTAL